MDGRGGRTTEQADRPFDPAREPAGRAADALIADVLNQVQNYEKHFGLRRRKRRAADQQAFERTVSAVISDLIHRELTAPGSWVAIPLSKGLLGGRNRARAVALNSTLPRVLERLSAPEMDFVEIKKGYRSPFGPGRQTVIRRGSRLLTRIEDHRLDLSDLGRDRRVLPDPLVVRSAKVAGKRGHRCRVADNETTRRYRADMDRINAFLMEADIACYFPKGEEEVTSDDRFIRRIFNNGSLEEGGRVYGGFWQGITKEERLSEILIQGEPVVALDFGQMAPRIAYGLVGATPPHGDLYCCPPFEAYRDGVKAVLNALLSSDGWPKRFPMGTREKFSRNATITEVVRAISDRHPALVPLFATQVCYRIFFVESEVLVATLLRLIDLDVVALPIHDCILVAVSKGSLARQVMLETFLQHTGVDGMVEEQVSTFAQYGKELILPLKEEAIDEGEEGGRTNTTNSS